MSPVPGTGLLFPSNKPDDEDGKTNENGKAGEFAEKTSNTSLHEHRVKQSPENNYDQTFLPKLHVAILTPPRRTASGYLLDIVKITLRNAKQHK